ncbi:VapC toxin family PIN domain ribonuclease [Klenkia sp. PcliD-1-E]|uniref:VapC toxin family PIN domain ribonuclease n=1 Tax=Klenkia sp. PcliD-1-E TaxID=2954492 RepID=UPI00211201C2|nr:VapC toxin family PIN domain ribonuclease [Klenkia sp. PcliD-1-E]
MPLTQGALVRHLVRSGAGSAQAQDVLGGLVDHPRHEFWPDGLTYVEVDLRAVVGHRQVTDAYLAGLSRTRGGRLVTLDRGLVAVHPDVATALDRG